MDIISGYNHVENAPVRLQFVYDKKKKSSQQMQSHQHSIQYL